MTNLYTHILYNNNFLKNIFLSLVSFDSSATNHLLPPSISGQKERDIFNKPSSYPNFFCFNPYANESALLLCVKFTSNHSFALFSLKSSFHLVVDPKYHFIMVEKGRKRL